MSFVVSGFLCPNIRYHFDVLLADVENFHRGFVKPMCRPFSANARQCF
jgi:hypothetical protein